MGSILHVSIAQVLTAVVAGYTIAALWRVLHLRKCRSCACRAAPGEDRRPLSWHGQLVEATLLTLAIVVLATRRPSLPLYIVVAAVFAVRAFRQCRAIVKQRPQFTLSGLFVFTTLVACICSASHYLPIIPLLVFVYLPAMEWARQQGRHCEGVMPDSESAPSGETTQAIIASRCERNIQHAWATFFRSTTLLVILLLAWLACWTMTPLITIPGL